MPHDGDFFENDIGLSVGSAPGNGIISTGIERPGTKLSLLGHLVGEGWKNGSRSSHGIRGIGADWFAPDLKRGGKCEGEGSECSDKERDVS